MKKNTIETLSNKIVDAFLNNKIINPLINERGCL